MTETPDTITVSWVDWRDVERTLEVNQVLDARDFDGTPGEALLIIAANTNLSVPELEMAFLRAGIERSRNWIQKRRWLFQ